MLQAYPVVYFLVEPLSQMGPFTEANDGPGIVYLPSGIDPCVFHRGTSLADMIPEDPRSLTWRARSCYLLKYPFWRLMHLLFLLFLTLPDACHADLVFSNIHRLRFFFLAFRALDFFHGFVHMELGRFFRGCR